MSSFACDLCERKTTTSKHLLRHKREVHYKEMSEEILHCAPDCDFPYTAARRDKLLRHRKKGEACTR